MTDAIKFPGTEMEVFEKYPLSRRLDFPSFGDVCKATFAKGVITDFEKISDDPIQVAPRVKVKGDFGESDFIPIFFNPKAKYWDGDGVLAQDFDAETGAFKQAWMSFRGDDEVAVMLKEGVPVAVLGFADGVPRIGEAIIKLKTQSIHTTFGSYWPNAFIDANKIDIYGSNKGPDGLDLKMLLEAERYDGTEETLTSGSGCYGNTAPYGTTVTNTPGFVTELPPDGSTDFTKVAVWIVKVGPIVYAIYGKFVEHYSEVYASIYYPGDELPTLVKTVQHTYYIKQFMIKSGIYKDGIVNDIVASVHESPGMDITDPNWWPVDIDGMFFQTDLSVALESITQFDAKSFDEVQWFVRPHTKAELQDAGLWPSGGA